MELRKGVGDFVEKAANRHFHSHDYASINVDYYKDF